MFFSYPFVQFILPHYRKILAERLFEDISNSGRSDVIVGERKYVSIMKEEVVVIM
ncbi:MAG: hypothetical protein PV340_02640 [Wolbachia sp.]|nr:hypothetical protein [Wolbachia sp.]